MANAYYDKKNQRWYVKNYVNGVNHTITSDSKGEYFLTKKAAQEFISINFRRLQFQKNNKNKKCDKFFPIFLKQLERTSKVTTFVDNKNLFVSKVEPLFKNIELSKLNNNLLMEFNNQINDKYKNYSIKRVISITRKFLTLLQPYVVNELDVKIISKDKNRPEQIKIQDYYTVDEFNIFYSFIDSKFYKFLFLMYFTYGLRLNELRGLQVKYFDIKNKLLIICQQANSKNVYHHTIIVKCKTQNSNRILPLNDKVINAYKDMIKFEDPNSYIFVGPRCKNLQDSKDPRFIIGESNIHRMVVKVEKKAKLHHVTIRNLRHSCGIYIEQNVNNISRVASWLGNSVVVASQYYLKFHDKEGDQIAQMMDKNIKT